EAAVGAVELVLVLAHLTVRAEELHALGDAGIVCADEPGVAVRGEVLHDPEAERAREAEGSDAPSVERCTVCVRAVLDDGQPPAARELQDWAELDGEPM